MAKPFLNENQSSLWHVPYTDIDGIRCVRVSKPDGMNASVCIGPTGRTVQIEKKSWKNDVVITLSHLKRYYTFGPLAGSSRTVLTGFEGWVTYTNLRTGVRLSLEFDVVRDKPHGILNRLNITDPSFKTGPSFAEAMGLKILGSRLV